MKMKKRLRYIAAIFLLGGISVSSSCSVEEMNLTGSIGPTFSWNDISAELDTDNGWGLTRYQNCIAVTHIEKRKQCVLSWEGGMESGSKENPILKWKDNTQQETLLLDALEISNNGLYYQLRFRKGGKTGMIKFTINDFRP